MSWDTPLQISLNLAKRGFQLADIIDQHGTADWK